MQQKLITAPMLCHTAELGKLRYPLLGTPKLDGIRCLKLGGMVLTRAFKLVPNEHVREALAHLPDGLDGELIAGTFNETQSAVMSHGGRPDFHFHAFDAAVPGTYVERIKLLPEAAGCLVPVLPQLLESEADLLRYEDEQLTMGYEGIVVRTLGNLYECKRSRTMFKLKRIVECDAVVVAVHEQMSNQNPAQRDVLGRLRRPGGQGGFVPKGTMGSLTVIADGVRFEVGSGFTDEERRYVWERKDAMVGAVVEVVFQASGMLNRPRFPRFRRFKVS